MKWISFWTGVISRITYLVTMKLQLFFLNLLSKKKSTLSQSLLGLVWLWLNKNMQISVVRNVTDGLLQLLVGWFYWYSNHAACVFYCPAGVLFHEDPAWLHLSPQVKTNTNAQRHSASQPGLLGLPSSFFGSSSPVQGAINSLSPPLRS